MHIILHFLCSFSDPFEPEWLPPYQSQREILVDTRNFVPVDYFQLFFPDSLLRLIVEETNRYAHQYLEAHPDLPPFSRFRSWHDTNSEEIKAYCGLQIAMGFCRKPEIADYWSTYWLTHTDFGSVMSRNRYELLSSFLHFANNEDRIPRGQNGHDPLFKVKKMLDIVNPLYGEVFCPGRDLSLDESMIRFKGRLYFKVYSPNKPIRWGIKQYALCEARTGYALKLITYSGQNTVPLLGDGGVTSSVVQHLLKDYEDKGHIVYMDNYYSSPQLFNVLEEKSIGACGTVRESRKNMPKTFPSKMKKGDPPAFKRCDNLVACAWHDTKRLALLSNVSTNNTISKYIRSKACESNMREVEKPVMAEVYNHNMGGVDLLDQKMEPYCYNHKVMKWYMTLYHRVKEVALVNGHILYTEDMKKAGARPLNQQQFRQSVVNSLVSCLTRERKPVGRPQIAPIPARLTERHFVGLLGLSSGGKAIFRDCMICSKNIEGRRKRTRYYCKMCDIPMCEEPCFELFHRYNDYKKHVQRIFAKES